MLPTVKLHTARVLRDYPGLRSIGKREEVLSMVRKSLPTASFSSVERFCRYFQNTKKMYLPIKNDQRFEEEGRYVRVFSTGIEGVLDDKTNLPFSHCDWKKTSSSSSSNLY